MFDGRVESDRVDNAGLIGVQSGDRFRKRVSHIFRQHLRVLRNFRIVEERLDDRHQVANGYTLLEEVLENFLYGAGRKRIRIDFVHESAVIFLQVVYKHLDFLAAQYLVGVPFQRLAEMSREHCSCFHHCEAENLRVVALSLFNPYCGESESRIRNGYSGQVSLFHRRAHGKVSVHVQLARSDLYAAYLYHVVTRL